MARIGNRVKETSDTTGTGTLDLNGAPTGFRGFADEFITGNDEISYLIVDDPTDPTEYEYGKGTFTTGTPNTLSRDTVEGSSNSGNKVSFSAGTKTVIATPTAADLNSLFGAGGWGTKSAKTRAITVSDSMVAADNGKTILADGSGNSPAGLTYTLLPASTAGDGFRVAIKRTGATGTVTYDGDGSEEVDGATTGTLDDQYESVELVCDGTEWHVVVQPASGIPPGAMLDYAGAGTVPEGWLLCDGSNVSRTTYAALFAVLSTTWGAGDGSTTFGLPDTRRRVSVGSGGTGTATLGNAVGDDGGAETHTLTTTEIPAHTHGVPVGQTGSDTNTAAVRTSNNQGTVQTASAGSGGAHNNMQPSIVVQKIIKT